MSWAMVAEHLLEYARVINELFANIIKILLNVNMGSVPDELITIIKGTSITLCVLFFLLDFFGKTMHLQWVTWENVLMLFIKLTIAKICVDNADKLMEIIYSGFTSMIATIASGGDFFANGLIDDVNWTPGCSTSAMLYGTKMCTFFGIQPNEVFSSTMPWTLKDDSWLNLEAVPVEMKAFVMYIIMVIILAIANVVVIARIFELTVYTAVAPLSLSTLACDGLTDVGKGFLKSYAAVCIQGLVLVIMFTVYSGIMNSGVLSSIPCSGLVNCFALALGVMQSGAWEKRICGAM